MILKRQVVDIYSSKYQVPHMFKFDVEKYFIDVFWNVMLVPNKLEGYCNSNLQREGLLVTELLNRVFCVEFNLRETHRSPLPT